MSSEITRLNETGALLAKAIVDAETSNRPIPWKSLIVGAIAFTDAAFLSYIGFGWRTAWPATSTARPYPIAVFFLGVAAAARLGDQTAKWFAIVASIALQAWVLPPVNSFAVAPEQRPWLLQCSLLLITFGFLVPASGDLVSDKKIGGGHRFRPVADIKSGFAALHQKIVG